MEAVLTEIRNATSHEINIIWGTTINRDLEDELVVTVVATGLELRTKEEDSDLARAVLEQMKWSQNENTNEANEISTPNIRKEPLREERNPKVKEALNYLLGLRGINKA